MFHKDLQHDGLQPEIPSRSSHLGDRNPVTHLSYHLLSFFVNFRRRWLQQPVIKHRYDNTGFIILTIRLNQPMGNINHCRKLHRQLKTAKSWAIISKLVACYFLFLLLCCCCTSNDFRLITVFLYSFEV